jgi:hypothetical protein
MGMEGVWAAGADCGMAIFSPIALTLGRRQEDGCSIDEVLEMISIAFSDASDVAIPTRSEPGLRRDKLPSIVIARDGGTRSPSFQEFP